MAIAARIWDGNDYLPVFFDKWVREVGFWVAEQKGRVVGCGKATHFGQGEWWLEGLRIDPDLQGHGLGTRLSLAILKRTLEYRPRSLRLSTAEVNHDSIRIIGRMGFEPMMATRLFWGKPRDMGAGHDRFPLGEIGSCPKSGTRVVRISSADAFAYLYSQEELWLKCGLLASTWKFRETTPGYLAELERQGFLYGVRGGRGSAAPRPSALRRTQHDHAQGDRPARRNTGRGLAGLLIAQPHLYDPRNLDVSHISGTPEAVRAFGRYLQIRLRRSGGAGFAGMATGPKMQRAFLRLGMKPERGIGRVLVFEHQTSG